MIVHKIYECEYCHAKSEKEDDIIKCESSHAAVNNSKVMNTLVDGVANWIIYTDGGARGNPGLGSYGWIILRGDQKILSQGRAFRLTTNNRMEILAVISALDVMSRSEHLNKSELIEIRSDSQLVVNTLTKNWARNSNRDLWMKLDSLRLVFPNLIFTKVKGHSGDHWNDEVDKVVNEAMDTIQVHGVLIDEVYESENNK